MKKDQPKHADQKLIEGIVQRDRQIVKEIYEAYFPKISVYVAKNSGNKRDAEDIFQESMIAIFQNAKKNGLVLNCPFGAYLLAVARNLWLNELKKRKRRQVTISDSDLYKVEETGEMLAGETSLDRERDRFFWEKFKDLGPSCQNILQLSWKGVGMKELSKKLKISYSYARKKKSECMARLASIIREAPEYQHLKFGL